MRYLDEYRDADVARRYADAIAQKVTRPWTVMEVCGGQTHAIVRFGLDRLLPESLELVHGPGCPVCVTPTSQIDAAIEIGHRGAIVCSFGDMLRVPGTIGDLNTAKAQGADVRVVYSPLDAVKLAHQTPDREVVFFAVGFETTAPANAMAVAEAERLGLTNFTLLVAHVLVPPAMEAILGSPDNRVQGFLAAGHVCSIEGVGAYPPIAEKYRVPIVVTGFEPADLLHGLYMCVKQLEEGRYEMENAYTRWVREEGNTQARELVDRIFEVTDREWRGIGQLEQSGLRLRESYRAFDAAERFRTEERPECATECVAAQVLQGRLKPNQCPAFGTRCTPETPLGAPMVSGEGACAAYFRYRGEDA